MNRNVLISACVLGLLAGLPARAGADRKKPGALLVLDASGSMAGKVAGRTKMTIAREVVGNLVQRWSPAIPLGLMAYGHRRKGDCDDIQMVVPVGPADPAALRQAVGRLSPRGHTPLSRAVRRAAAALKGYSGGATIILISDGKETCGEDSCAVARALKRANAGLVIHVVGFDLSRAERRGVACIAKNTGGKFFPARDSGSLRKAMDRAVSAMHARTGMDVRLVGRMARGGPLLKRDIHWFVRQGKGGKRVKEIIIPSAKLLLKPGTYQVEARVGSLKVHKQISVTSRAGIQQHEVLLNAGTVRLRATLVRGGKSAAGLKKWSFFRLEDGKRVPAGWSISGRPQKVFTAGSYVALAVFNPAAVEHAFTVEAGKTMDVEVVLAAGQISLRAARRPGGPRVKGAYHWKLFRLDGGKARSAGWSLWHAPAFVLVQGRYRADLTVKGKGKVSLELTVKAGEVSTRELILK